MHSNKYNERIDRGDINDDDIPQFYEHRTKYCYKDRTVFYEKTGNTLTFPDKAFLNEISSSLNVRLLHPLNRINHYDEIVKFGNDKTGTELLLLIDFLSDVEKNNADIKISSTIKGIKNEVNITSEATVKNMIALAEEGIHRMYCYGSRYSFYPVSVAFYEDKKQWLKQVKESELKLIKYKIPNNGVGKNPQRRPAQKTG